MQRFILSLGALLGICGHAYAVTECKGAVQSYFLDTGAAATAAGTPAKIWVVMPNGLQWYILQSDTASNAILAGVNTAIATGLPLTVRFQASGLTCDVTAGVRTDVLGAWLSIV